MVLLHAAAAARNLDTAIPLLSAETELQNTKEVRTMYAQQIAAPKPDLDATSEKKTIWKHLLKEHYRTFKRKIASAKTEKIC